MKYYYGNSYKEAVSNEPIEIKDTDVLSQYQECYSVVIPAYDYEDEDDENIVEMFFVYFNKDNKSLYKEFDNKEDAFKYAIANVANLPEVYHGYQHDDDGCTELGDGDDYEEDNITDECDELVELLNQLSK